MRALIDTNVLFSALLAVARPSAPIAELVNCAIRNEYSMLVPEEVLGELLDVWERKQSFHPAISDEQARRFVQLLRNIAEIIRPSADPIPRVFRDRGDDFLLTACVMGRADYLVTGDRDILDIRDSLSQPGILTVTEFLGMFSVHGSQSPRSRDALAVSRTPAN
ncbi:MAG: putative toxin-antitoxin system toxin component, PIN family [Thermomicrobiales bacterium]|nr:putative toxin-antitoxin system toxin component, PIN family [Thermomicrobiales bacterium]